jgi:dihydroflavonol-4-reductase
MRAAVTGANGLLGAHVVRALQEAGHNAVAVVRERADLRGLTGVDAPLARADTRSRDALLRAFDGAELVVHCAAVYSYSEDASRLERSNVDGTRRVMEAASEAGVRRVVLTSSSVTCGSSAGPYQRDESGAIEDEWVPPYFRTKQRQEQVAAEVADARGLELVVACPTVVLGGPDWRLVPSNAVLVRYLLDPTRTTFPGGCNVVAVRDVARGHVLLAEHGTPGERYLLGGEDLGWRTLHTLVSELTGISGPHLTGSRSSAWLAASVAEGVARLTGKPSLATRDEARTVGRWYWYSSAKAAGLGYTARPARAAVAGALAWLVTSPHVPRLARENLTLAQEVYDQRALVAAPLPPSSRTSPPTSSSQSASTRASSKRSSSKRTASARRTSRSS